MMEGLCKEVEKRMENVGVKGFKVTLKLKQRKSGAPPPPKYLGHGSCHNLSKRVEVRTKEATRNWKYFFKIAMEMFYELKVEKDDVRGMGIVISKLVDDVCDAFQESNGTHSISTWLRRPVPTMNEEKSWKKVDFILPAHMPDNAVAEIDDESIRYDTLCKSSLSKVTRNSDTGCNDIVIPAFSQIHMSQVNALPSPMRKQIIAKMANGKRTVTSEVDDLAGAILPNHTGQAISGQAISLKQLEWIPLELQLEIANEDLKKNQKGKNPGIGSRPSNANETTAARKYTTPRPMQLENVGIENSDVILHDTVADYMATNFFRDNVMPLMEYMNKNPEADVIAIQHVSAFLCICVAENRLTDIVVLLQNIKKHGNNRWCINGFEVIFDIVDRHVLQHYRANLDKKWVIQL